MLRVRAGSWGTSPPYFDSLSLRLVKATIEVHDEAMKAFLFLAFLLVGAIMEPRAFVIGLFIGLVWAFWPTSRYDTTR